MAGGYEGAGLDGEGSLGMRLGWWDLDRVLGSVEQGLVKKHFSAM